MVKEKQTRTYDPDGFRRRAACLCVRDSDESEILLVTSSRMTDHWIVPGGGVEPNEDASDAAIRETEEEAGVRGSIKRCLGDFEVRDEHKERKHRTSVYVLEVTQELDEWDDCKSRLRRWFSLEEALRLLLNHKPVQCTYITLMIKTSPILQKSASHLLSLVEPHLKQNTTLTTAFFPPNITNSSSCKSTSTGTSMNPPPTNTERYLHVNHYPASGGSSNAHFNAFICSRDVYSTDSDTAEDGAIGLNEAPNHFSESGSVCEGENGKKTEIMPMAESSSVNS